MAKVSRNQYQTNNAAATAYGINTVGGVTRQMHIDRDAELSDSARFLLDPIVEEAADATLTFTDTIGKYYRLQTANNALTGAPTIDFTDAIKGAFSIAKWTGALPDFSNAPYVLAESIERRYDSTSTNWIKFTYIGDGTTNRLLVELLNHFSPESLFIAAPDVSSVSWVGLGVVSTGVLAGVKKGQKWKDHQAGTYYECFDDGQITRIMMPQLSRPLPLSDQVTQLTTGLKLTMRWPFDSIVDDVLLSCKDAAQGQAIIVDVFKNGVSIYTTKVQIDPDVTSSVGSIVTPVFVANANIFEPNDLLEIYATQVGTPGDAGVGLIADFIYRQII